MAVESSFQQITNEYLSYVDPDISKDQHVEIHCFLSMLLENQTMKDQSFWLLQVKLKTPLMTLTCQEDN